MRFVRVAAREVGRNARNHMEKSIFWCLKVNYLLSLCIKAILYFPFLFMNNLCIFVDYDSSGKTSCIPCNGCFSYMLFFTWFQFNGFSEESIWFLYDFWRFSSYWLTFIWVFLSLIEFDLPLIESKFLKPQYSVNTQLIDQ